MTVITTNDACLNILEKGQDIYFDVRVFYPYSSSYHSLTLTSVYKHDEDAKKCEY